MAHTSSRTAWSATARRAINSDGMLFLGNVRHLIAGCFAYAVVSRRVSLLIALLVGFVLLAIGSAGQAAAPFVVYPFV